MRLQKFMAHAGIAARRKCEQIISQKRVTINGQVVTVPGTKIDPEKDVVKLDNIPVKIEESTVYYLLNKPKYCITSTYDPEGRTTVLDYVQVSERVYPVGRLDYDSRGLVLLTNDGELANRLLHPRYQVPKTYLVKVDKVPDSSQAKKLLSGVDLEEGVSKFQKLDFEYKQKQNVLIILLTEGRKRQIKRMLSIFDIKVLDLQRIKFGPIELAGLQEGKFRALKNEEISQLHSLTRIN